MRIMVTGATTPLGAAIVDDLLGAPDVAFVLGVGAEPDVARRDPKLGYRSVDLTRPREVQDLLRGTARSLSIDAVVHAAQHRDVHDVGRRVHTQNVEAARELVLGCADHPTIRRFLYRSFAEVYAQRDGTTSLINEDQPLDFDPTAPQWLRDRVEADLTVSAQRGGALQIAVLRCAELLAPASGSQLWDYVQSRVCLRPAGFDPIINVLSTADAAAAFTAALRSTETGVFNIPGADTLPLSRAIAESYRMNIAMPGVLLAPLYKLRRAVAGFEFRYDLNARRFHFGGVLDGSRARRVLGYVPRTPVKWPWPWWRELFTRLAEQT